MIALLQRVLDKGALSRLFLAFINFIKVSRPYPVQTALAVGDKAWFYLRAFGNLAGVSKQYYARSGKSKSFPRESNFHSTP